MRTRLDHLSLKKQTRSRLNLQIDFFHEKKQSHTKTILTTKIRSIAILNKKKSFISTGQLQVRQMCIKNRGTREKGEEEEKKKKKEEEERKKPIECNEWSIAIDQ